MSRSEYLLHSYDPMSITFISKEKKGFGRCVIWSFSSVSTLPVEDLLFSINPDYPEMKNLNRVSSETLRLLLIPRRSVF